MQNKDAELELARADCNRSKQETAVIAEKLTRSEKDRDIIQKKHNSLVDQNKTLKDSLSCATTNNSNLQTRVKELEARIVSQEEVESLTNKVYTLEKSEEELKKSILAYQKEILTYKEDNLSLQKQNATLKNSYDKATADYKAVFAEKIKLETELSSKHSGVEELIEVNYNIKNAHPRDKYISFEEEEHVYMVGNQNLKSVTTIIKESFPPFDAERYSILCARNTGRTAESYIEEWDRRREESRKLGTIMHANIEKFFLGEPYEDGDVFGQFLNFSKEHILVPYRTEWPIYDEEIGVAGTLDFLDYQNGEYTIYDWKRSKTVVTKTGKPIVKSRYQSKGFSPISNVEDASYWHYALQTSIYRYILGKNYGIDVSQSRLVVMHPEINKAFMIEVPYMEKEALALLSRIKAQKAN